MDDGKNQAGVENPEVKTAKRGKEKPKIKVKRLDPLEDLKMEIAAELGLLDKVKDRGWDSLSAQEAGRIGGHMTQRLKK